MENEWATVLKRIAALESAVAALMLTPATSSDEKPAEVAVKEDDANA